MFLLYLDTVILYLKLKLIPNFSDLDTNFLISELIYIF